MYYLLITFLLLHGQVPDRISYRTLHWADFKRQPPADSLDILAVTKWDWELSTTIEPDGRSYFSVRCYFVPSESFTRTTDLYILSHEQIHFIIANQHCTQLEKALKAIGGCTNCEVAANDMFSIAYAKTVESEHDYDTFTHHGQDREMQDHYEKLFTNDKTPGRNTGDAN